MDILPARLPQGVIYVHIFPLTTVSICALLFIFLFSLAAVISLYPSAGYDLPQISSLFTFLLKSPPSNKTLAKNSICLNIYLRLSSAGCCWSFPLQKKYITQKASGNHSIYAEALRNPTSSGFLEDKHK
jgi:hypothetical protein